jgi:hypothetical protein
MTFSADSVPRCSFIPPSVGVSRIMGGVEEG